VARRDRRRTSPYPVWLSHARSSFKGHLTDGSDRGVLRRFWSGVPGRPRRRVLLDVPREPVDDPTVKLTFSRRPTRLLILSGKKLGVTSRGDLPGDRRGFRWETWRDHRQVGFSRSSGTKVGQIFSRESAVDSRGGTSPGLQQQKSATPPSS
jgi:hypothetical protein